MKPSIASSPGAAIQVVVTQPSQASTATVTPAVTSSAGANITPMTGVTQETLTPGSTIRTIDLNDGMSTKKTIDSAPKRSFYVNFKTLYSDVTEEKQPLVFVDFLLGIAYTFVSFLYFFDGLTFLLFDREILCFYSRKTDFHENETRRLGFLVIEGLSILQLIYFTIILILFVATPALQDFAGFIGFIFICIIFVSVMHFINMQYGWIRAGITAMLLNIIVLIEMSHSVYFTIDSWIEMNANESSDTKIRMQTFVACTVLELFQLQQFTFSWYLLFPHSPKLSYNYTRI